MFLTFILLVKLINLSLIVGENSDPESNHNSAPALHEEVNEQQLSSTAMQTMTQSTSSDPEVEQLTKLPETVTHIIAKNGVNVYIVGTAHFSQESQEDVAKVGVILIYF